VFLSLALVFTMDSSPTTPHRSSLLGPGLLLILLFLTSTNFAVFLKQQCHWVQKIPLVSKVITCSVQPETQVEMTIIQRERCPALDLQAFRAYDNFEALGYVAPDRTARANRAITVHRTAAVGEHAVHRIVITRGGATSDCGLRLNRALHHDYMPPTFQVESLLPE